MSKKNPNLSLELEYWPIEDLVPYDRNPRLHSPGQVEQIARSIKEFGQTSGLVYKIDEDIHGVKIRRGQVVTRSGRVLCTWPPQNSLIRYGAVDFGFTNPFCYLHAVKLPDEQLLVTHCLYARRITVSNWARVIKAILEADKEPRAVWADHDAEDRAELQKHRIYTNRAKKDNLLAGIELVRSILHVQENDLPRVFFLMNTPSPLEMPVNCMPLFEEGELYKYPDEAPEASRDPQNHFKGVPAHQER